MAIVGIDLGTTNSLIGVFEDGKARLIENANGGFLTPSAVYVDQNGEIVVGGGQGNGADQSRRRRDVVQALDGHRPRRLARQAELPPRNSPPSSSDR